MITLKLSFADITGLMYALKLKVTPQVTPHAKLLQEIQLELSSTYTIKY